MKTCTLWFCGALALAGTAAAYSPPVTVYGRASYNDRTLILNVFADSTAQLRSFGIRIGFDPTRVLLSSVAGNDALWFLAAKPGSRSVYTPSQVAADSVRIVGARFQGDQPAHGVSGSEFLLASLTFERISVDLPSFQLALAGPVHYASFVTTDGTNMDGTVEGLGTLVLSFQVLADDSDGDGIPDDVELAWFGTLTRANATTDSDGDGVKDIDEWIGGTNAADPKSVTRLVLTTLPDGNRSLSWNGQPGRVYDLLWSGDLTAFVPIAEGLTPASPNSILDTIPANQGFYRLRVHLNP
jgi:hypothetical protein